MKVGDLIKHRSAMGAHWHTGIVTKVILTGPPGCPVYVTALWSGPRDWPNERSTEQQYLEVISEGR